MIIYGSIAQYDEFYEWCKEHRPDALGCFYDRNGYDNQNYRPITNFPEELDMWMLEHCPLEFVLKRLKNKYNL